MEVNRGLIDAARTHVGKMDRLFSILEDQHGEVLAKNPDYLRDYAAICADMEAFEHRTMDEQLQVVQRSVEFMLRVKFLLNSLYGSTSRQRGLDLFH